MSPESISTKHSCSNVSPVHSCTSAPNWIMLSLSDPMEGQKRSFHHFQGKWRWKWRVCWWGGGGGGGGDGPGDHAHGDSFDSFGL
eukprot:2495936-Amphidinium_carterae.1